MYLRAHAGSINTNVLGKFMLDRITSNTDRPMLSEDRGVGVEVVTLKSSSRHLSHVTLAFTVAIARNSASALDRETAICFLVFQAIKEDPRKTQ